MTLKVHILTEFGLNPNQTHLKKSQIERFSQVSSFTMWTSRVMNPWYITRQCIPENPNTATITIVLHIHKVNYLTWPSMFSVAIHFLSASVRISRLLGVSIRQLHRGSSCTMSASVLCNDPEAAKKHHF